ncbi:MAG: hypothetical protein ACKVGZ_13650 [Alphaproteobacteria bacterium]|jgi:hypothetical protein
MAPNPAAYPSGAPVAAITEADATGEIAEIYADIRATLGVPVVNLIWRHLATIEGALPWTWTSVRPIYVSGAVAGAAAHLRQSLVLPGVQDWPVTVLEAAGLDAAAREGIGRVLASYDRSNAMNMVALSALQAAARGQQDATPLPSVDPGRDVAGTLPLLQTLDQMTPATADLVYRLNAIGDPDHKVIASMYRHLSHWPPFLALMWERLAPMNADGRIEAMIAQNLGIAQGIARQLAAQMPAAQAPSDAVMGQVNTALDLFIRYAIGRMLPIGRMTAGAFPTGQ